MSLVISMSHWETPDKSQEITARPPEWLKFKRMATPVVGKDVGPLELSYIGR